MKRIAMLVLSVLLAVTAVFTGCAETAGDVYRKAEEKMAGYNAIEAKIEMKTVITTAELEEPINTEMKYTVKTGNMKGDNPVAYADIVMTLLGRDMGITSYAEGDYVYVSLMGEGIKVPADSATASSYSGADVIDGYLLDMPDEMLESVELTETEDGASILSFSFDGDEYSEILEGITAGVMSGIASDMEGYELSIGQVSYVMTVEKDSDIKKIALTMDMDIGFGGQTMNAEVEAVIEYVAFDDDVKITPPEGYLDFPEVDE